MSHVGHRLHPAPATAAAARRRAPWTLHRSPRARRVALRTLSLAVFLGAWWLVAELDVWSDLFVPDPTAVFGRLIDGETVHDGARGLSGYYLWEHLCGQPLAHHPRRRLGDRLRRPARPAAGHRHAVSRDLRAVRDVRARAAAAGLLQPADHLVRHRGHLEGLAALPRRLPADRALGRCTACAGIPRRQLDGALALGASRWQVTRFVVLPSVLPELFTGIRLALGFAWTTIVAAETVDGIPGIGGLAWETKKFQQTDIAVLCIVVIGLAAIVLDQLVRALEQRVVPWRGKS